MSVQVILVFHTVNIRLFDYMQMKFYIADIVFALWRTHFSGPDEV